MLKQPYNKRISLILRTAFLCLILAATTGCKHRDLCFDHNHNRVGISVEFDWQDEPDAAPAEMMVYFYRLNAKTGTPIVYEFRGHDGGRITLPAGTYAALCFNSDATSHSPTGHDAHENFGLRLNDFKNNGFDILPSLLPRAQDAENERIANAPDPLWVASLPMVIIDVAEPGAEEQVVTFRMKSVIYNYTFILRNPINFTSSMTITASISGMASTVHPGRDLTGEETVTHLFGMRATSDGNLIGQLLTFGHCASKPLGRSRDDDEVPHHLTVYAVMADGQNWYSSHDVTAQIHGSSRDDIVVVLDSVAFPEHGGAGAGFQPTVSGWINGSKETVGM